MNKPTTYRDFAARFAPVVALASVSASARELGRLLGARFDIRTPRTRVVYGNLGTYPRVVPDGGTSTVRYGWRDALHTIRIERQCCNRVIATANGRTVEITANVPMRRRVNTSPV